MNKIYLFYTLSEAYVLKKEKNLTQLALLSDTGRYIQRKNTDLLSFVFLYSNTVHSSVEERCPGT